MVLKSKDFCPALQALVLALSTVVFQLQPTVAFSSDLLNGKGLLCQCDDNRKKKYEDEKYYCNWTFSFFFAENKAVYTRFFERNDTIGEEKRIIEYQTTSSRIAFDVLKDGSFYYVLDRQTLNLRYGTRRGYECQLADTPISFGKMIETERARLKKYMLSERKSNKL